MEQNGFSPLETCWGTGRVGVPVCHELHRTAAGQAQTRDSWVLARNQTAGRAPRRGDGVSPLSPTQESGPSTPPGQKLTGWLETPGDSQQEVSVRDRCTQAGSRVSQSPCARGRELGVQLSPRPG